MAEQTQTPIEEAPTETSIEGSNEHPIRFPVVRHLSSSSKWPQFDDDLESFIRDLPKLELHIHLDGSFDPNLLWNFLQSDTSEQCFPVSFTPPWQPDTPLPIRERVLACRSSRDFHSLCTCRGHRSLGEMLNRFQYFLPLVQGHIERIEQLALDFCARQWQQNTVYTEVRYSPHLLASQQHEDVSADTTHAADVVQAVTRGLTRGCETYGITVHQILCAISWRPEWALPTLELALDHRDDNMLCPVVGVDIAAGEEHFADNDWHGPHLAMAQRAHAANMPLALHAGEIPNPVEGLQHVKQAILEYKASRIGHGYRMAQPPLSSEVMELVKEHRVHVEVCPTSSVETGGWMDTEAKRAWNQHPATVMMDAGLSVSLSSDDPAVFHTSLAWQYRIALVKMGRTREQMIQMNLDAIEASFCKQETKERLRKKLVSFARERIPGWNPSTLFSSTKNVVDPPSDHVVQRAPLEETTTDFADRVYLTDSLYT